MPPKFELYASKVCAVWRNLRNEKKRGFLCQITIFNSNSKQQLYDPWFSFEQWESACKHSFVMRQSIFGLNTPWIFANVRFCNTTAFHFYYYYYYFFAQWEKVCNIHLWCSLPSRLDAQWIMSRFRYILSSRAISWFLPLYFFFPYSSDMSAR